MVGGAYALTVLTRVRAGAEGMLAEHLARFEGQSPFEKLPRTHFARFVLVPASVLPGGPRERHNGLERCHLLFSATFDGPLERYLDDICVSGATELEAIWRCCEGFPQKGFEDMNAAKRYVRSHQLNTGLFYSGYPGQSVEHIRASLDRRKRLLTFVLRAPTVETGRLKDEFLRDVAKRATP